MKPGARRGLPFLNGGTQGLAVFSDQTINNSRIEFWSNREERQMFLRTLKKHWILFWVTAPLFVATPVPLLLANDLPTPTCKFIERSCQVCMNNVCSSVGTACQPKVLVCPDEEARMKYAETIWQEQREAILQEMKKNEASQKDGSKSSEAQ